MDYKEAYDAMAVVMGTDQTAQGEAGKWECAICREMLNHGEGVAYHKSLGHDVRRVEGKS